MTEIKTEYPAKLSIDYPDKGLNRLTTFFRLFTAIPILIILALLVVAAPTILMLVFRRKYPRWWFDWNLSKLKFGIRVGAYLMLLRDEYPSTDDEQAIHVDIPYPDAKRDLNRWLPLIKWFLAIPHVVILCFLGVASIICCIIAWFAILFTGHYPKSLFDFVVGVKRWSLRVTAYAFLLTTDYYPPFRLSE